MNSEQVATLRALLAPSGWLDQTALFAAAVRRSARTPNGLLVIGTADAEPWHMTAHLAEESRLAGLPELTPTLIRWAPAPGAPAHLSIGLDRLAAATRTETLLVVSPDLAPAELLERVHDVRRAGATILALDQDDPELDGLAHESLQVRQDIVPISFDAAQHLVTSAVAAEAAPRGSHQSGRQPMGWDQFGWRADHPDRAGPTGLRARLARLLDSVSGPPAD
jgi:hypothetical protein